MSDLRGALDGDEAFIYTLNPAMVCDEWLGQTRNDIDELYGMSGYYTCESPESKRLKEENPEGSNTLGQTRNDNKELDGIFDYDTSESPERKRLKEENPEGSNALETRVPNKRERSKYKCGKCGVEKKHHICPVDQVRAGRRWAKQHAWTQTPTEFMQEGGSERAEPEEESGIVAPTWNEHRMRTKIP